MRLKGRRHWTQTITFFHVNEELPSDNTDPWGAPTTPTGEKQWVEYANLPQFQASVQDLDREELQEYGLTLEQQHFFVRCTHVPGIKIGDGVKWLETIHVIEVINGIPGEDTEIIMRKE